MAELEEREKEILEKTTIDTYLRQEEQYQIQKELLLLEREDYAEWRKDRITGLTQGMAVGFAIAGLILKILVSLSL